MSLIKTILTVRENPKNNELLIENKDVREVPYEKLTKAITKLGVSWPENLVHADIGQRKKFIYSLAGGNVIYDGEEMSFDQTLTFLNEDESKIHYMGYLLGLESFLEKRLAQ